MKVQEKCLGVLMFWMSTEVHLWSAFSYIWGHSFNCSFLFWTKGVIFTGIIKYSGAPHSNVNPFQEKRCYPEMLLYGAKKPIGTHWNSFNAFLWGINSPLCEDLPSSCHFRRLGKWGIGMKTLQAAILLTRRPFGNHWSAFAIAKSASLCGFVVKRGARYARHHCSPSLDWGT